MFPSMRSLPFEDGAAVEYKIPWKTSAVSIEKNIRLIPTMPNEHRPALPSGKFWTLGRLVPIRNADS